MRKEEIAALRGENMYRCGRLHAKLLHGYLYPCRLQEQLAVCCQTLHVSGAVWVFTCTPLMYPVQWRSAFYERLKDVRDYHRRYPYLEVSEVSAAPSVSL